MTNLPATFIEAEAVTFAREWIAAHREPGGIFHTDAKRESRAMMKQYALAHPFGADEIVYFAENDSKEADLALRELIAERVDRGEPLGAVLGAYNIRLLNPLRPRRHGPPMADNFVRDVGISALVASLLERFLELRKGKNPASKRASAYSIASRALIEANLGIVLGGPGVERIWRRYEPAVAGMAPRFLEIQLPADYGGLFWKRPRSSASNY